MLSTFLGRLGRLLVERPHDSNPSAEHPQAAQGKDWRFSALVALFALVPRLFVAIAWAREPVWDGHYYHFGGLRIAQGLGYSEDVLIGGELIWKPWCHYPVGYSALLGGLYALFGASLLVAPVFGALVGTLTTFFGHRLARYFLSPARARLGAILIAIHPGLIAYSAVVMTEPVAALFLLLAGLAALSFSTAPRGLVLAGLIIGAGTLVRPPSLVAVILLMVAFGRPYRAALLKGAVVLAVSLLTILPWTVRNCRVMDGCALVSTNGGWNLAIGALSPSGRFHTLTAEDGCRVVTGQVQQDRCWLGVGLREIADAPGAWLKKIPLKLEHTYNHESFPIAYLREANPRAWSPELQQTAQGLLTVYHHLLMFGACLSLFSFPLRLNRAGRLSVRLSEAPGARLQAALLTLFLGLVVWVLSADVPPMYALISAAPLLALLGLPGAPHQGPAGRYLIGALLATTLTHAVFFGDDRYHMVISPVLCLLAAAALRPAAGSTPNTVPPLPGSTPPGTT